MFSSVVGTTFVDGEGSHLMSFLLPSSLDVHVFSLTGLCGAFAFVLLSSLYSF